MTNIMQQLLGCGWGRFVATADDMEPCPEKADRVVVLHDGPSTFTVRLCAQHIVTLTRATDPHVEIVEISLPVLD